MGLREQTREAVRSAIADTAVALFDERGFDETSVEDVAAAAGISLRSFYRYFPTKEDAVLADPRPFGEVVRDALAARPGSEPPWTAMRGALQPLVEATVREPARTLRIVRVATSTPSLRARHFEKHLVWAELMRPVMTARLPRAGLTEPQLDVQAQAIVVAGLSCLDAAWAGWIATNGTGDFREFLDVAFAALD